MVVMLRGTVLAWIATAGTLAGSELVVRDATLDLHLLPTAFQYSVRDYAGSRSGSGSFDLALGAGAGLQYSFAPRASPHAGILGAEVTYGRSVYTDATYTLVGGRLLGGYAYAINDWWHLVGLAWGGGGQARFSVAGSPALGSIAASGGYLEYGARIGVVHGLSERWLLSAAVGYCDVASRMDGAGSRLSIEGRGVVVGLGIAYRFSRASARLE